MQTEIKKFFDDFDKLEFNEKHSFFLENIFFDFLQQAYRKQIEIAEKLLIASNFTGENLKNALEIIIDEYFKNKSYDSYYHVAALLRINNIDIEQLTLEECLIILATILKNKI